MIYAMKDESLFPGSEQDEPAGEYRVCRPKPIWYRCEDCENFLCSIHGIHAHDCDCPSLEEWDEAGIDPYTHTVDDAKNIGFGD